MKSPRLRTPVVYWPAVGTAAAVAVLLLAGLCAWAKTHPRPRKAVLPEAVTVSPLVLPTSTADDPPQPQTSDASAPTITETPPERSPGAGLRGLTPPAPERQPAADLRGLRLPALEQQPIAAPAPRAETYGTSVTFLSSPAEAARQARRENKLLFVLHIAGNFEESCFT
jgi:hypothetical protein